MMISGLCVRCFMLIFSSSLLLQFLCFNACICFVDGKVLYASIAQFRTSEIERTILCYMVLNFNLEIRGVTSFS